jgi:hypothetical protein
VNHKNEYQLLVNNTGAALAQICNFFPLLSLFCTERKRLSAPVKPLSAHDVYFEDNTSLEILDDVEINNSNASDLIMIHDLEDLKVNFEMKIGNTLKELGCFVFFYFEIVRYLFFHVMPLKCPDIFAPFLLVLLRL